MAKLKDVSFPNRYLDCFEAALVTALKYIGVLEETLLIGRRVHFVLDEARFDIAPRSCCVTEEWERDHGLTLGTLTVDDETDLKDQIMTQVSHDVPVCMPVDIYFLPFTPHHNNLHQSHFVNVFGYDDDIYYIVCPYYRFRGWLDSGLMHSAFFSLAAELRKLFFVTESKLKGLSPNKVHQLLRESCYNMLGLAVPGALTGVNTQHLGLAGIRTFSDLLCNLLIEQHERLPFNTLELSQQLMAVSYSRYWFRKLIEAYQQYLLPASVATRLLEQLVDATELWKAIGVQTGASVHANNQEMMKRAATIFGQVHKQEYFIFNTLLGALPDYEGGII